MSAERKVAAQARAATNGALPAGEYAGTLTGVKTFKRKKDGEPMWHAFVELDLGGRAVRTQPRMVRTSSAAMDGFIERCGDRVTATVYHARPGPYVKVEFTEGEALFANEQAAVTKDGEVRRVGAETV